jgi:hypothetical protein
MQRPDRSMPAPDELDDAQFGRLVADGAVLGVPLAYVISLLVILPGAGWHLALWMAAWPALVAGMWVGGMVMLLKRSGELEARPDVITAATPHSEGRALGHAA